MESGYVPEEFTDEEREVLERYFTSTTSPVFGVVGLPQVVTAALFARYSRSSKGLRRLFLDEFASDVTGEDRAGVGSAPRAEALFARVFDAYGDDSVAQLGSAHVACEGVSNILAKEIEWGRAGSSYLEQSTRYLDFASPAADGRRRWWRDPVVAASPLGDEYERVMEEVFDTYSEVLEALTVHVRATVPQSGAEGPWKAATRAKALDAVRGLLPTSTTTNLGIHASGQAFEALLCRLAASPRAEAREYAEMMLVELRKVIPSFLVRVDRTERGVAWSRWIEARRDATQQVAARVVGTGATELELGVRLVRSDPDAEERLLVGIIQPLTHASDEEVRDVVRSLGEDERREVVEAYAGDRSNRRHKPGRALEDLWYRFEVVSDYGAFKDLQRHRYASIEWQEITGASGFVVPALVEEAGQGGRFREACQALRALEVALRGAGLGAQAPYAVPHAAKVRFTIGINARAAMQMLELRSGEQGHESYRRVAQAMHRALEEAGHVLVARMMTFVDHSTPGSERLERLEAEKRLEAKRSAAVSP